MDRFSKGPRTEAAVEDLPPDLHELFCVYDTVYFQHKLQDHSVFIRWSNKSMTRCAGYCRMVPAGGVEIVISEPLHKYRTNTELKETVLHEMIHALDFITPNSRRDHDGHGVFFQTHMHRINSSQNPHDPYRPPHGSYHITVYHNFTDEVRSYQQHVWRCERCGHEIRRSMNREPSEKDCRAYRKDASGWIPATKRPPGMNRCGDPKCFVHNHMRMCGGVYSKCSSPPAESRNARPNRKLSRIASASAPCEEQRKSENFQIRVALEANVSCEAHTFASSAQKNSPGSAAADACFVNRPSKRWRVARGRSEVIDVDALEDTAANALPLRAARALDVTRLEHTFESGPLGKLAHPWSTSDAGIRELLEMGFLEQKARAALHSCDGQLAEAVALLIDQ